MTVSLSITDYDLSFTRTIPLKFTKFPGGERNVTVEHNDYSIEFGYDRAYIECDFRGSDDLIDVLLVANAVRHWAGSEIKLDLNIPYFPCARVDSYFNKG